MTDHADLVARLRARAAWFDGLMGNLASYDEADADLDREAADALSRPPVTVTEEMVERAAAEMWRQSEASLDRPLPWDRCPPDEYPHWLADARAILTAALGTSLQKAQGSPPEGAISWAPLSEDTVRFSRLSEGTGVDSPRPPASGPETYPGHDPAAGLPQPDTAGGADPQDAEYFAILSRSTKNPKRLYREDEVAAIRAEATAKERERAETWRRVAIDCLERILKMVEPRSAIAEEAGVALVALKPARKQ